MVRYHLVIDASPHDSEESQQSFPPAEKSHLSSDDILSLCRGWLTRRIFFKEDQFSLTIVGSDVSGNSMSYENISHFGFASHEDHLGWLNEVTAGERQIADLFEGFIIAVDQALKTASEGLENDDLQEIHVIGSNMSRWEADETSSQSVKNSISRNQDKLRIKFIGPEPCPFALWAEEEEVGVGGGAEALEDGEGADSSQLEVQISPPDVNEARPTSTDTHPHPHPSPSRVYEHYDPRRWCLEILLRPGIKSVKAVTTCRVGLDFCNGGFQVPGYMYLSCKENPLPSMKKGEPTVDHQLVGGDASGTADGEGKGAVIMNRVRFTQNDEGMEEEIEGSGDEDEIVTAYVYGDRFVPINSIDKNLIELPAEEKSLKVLDVVKESLYETFFIHGQTSLFVPDPNCGAQSYQAMQDLCKSLKRQKLGLVARLKARANHSPKLVLMLPADRMSGKRKVGAAADGREKAAALSWCLTMNNLTYAGDVRRHNFVSGRRSLSSDQLTTAYEIVKRNSLNPDSLLRWNPAYRRLLTVLVAKAYSKESDISEICDWIDRESVREEPATDPDHAALNLPEQTADIFKLHLKVTRVEDRLRTWKQATQINLTDMFPDVIVIDRSDPATSLHDLMKEHAKEVLTLIKIVTIFGDLINESLVINRGNKFPELLQALKDATLKTLGDRAKTDTSEDVGNLIEAYNQIVTEAISIVKLDRQVFVDVEAALKPPIFILDSEASAGRSFVDAERIIQSIQEAPAKQVDLPTQDTGVPVTQPDFRDEEFDDLE